MFLKFPHNQTKTNQFAYINQPTNKSPNQSKNSTLLRLYVTFVRMFEIPFYLKYINICPAVFAIKNFAQILDLSVCMRAPTYISIEPSKKMFNLFRTVRKSSTTIDTIPKTAICCSSVF